MMWFVAHRSISPEGESLLALPKSNQKASPCTPLLPAVLATGGMRIATIGAIRSRVCADDACTTARCSAPRRGLKGRFVEQQLCGKSLFSYGHRPINGKLSTLDVFSDLAHIEWTFQEKAACSLEGAKRIRGSCDVHSVGIKFDFAKLGSSGAIIPVTATSGEFLV